MTRISILGGTGYSGAAVAAEAARRGHQVTAYSRNAPEQPVDRVTYVTGSALDPEVLAQAVRDTDVVIDAISPRGDMAGQVEPVFEQLMAAADQAGVRLGTVGGVSSTLVSENGPRLIDAAPLPEQMSEETRLEVGLGLWKLDQLKASDDSLDWFYVSPAQNYGSWLEQRVTGGYRISDDVLLTDENGESYIAAPDLALAVVDEIEQQAHRRRRFHVAL